MKAILPFLALLFLPIFLHAQDQQKLLEHSYKTHSKKELKQFFDNWHKKIPPVSDSEFAKLNDLQKETYKVFEEFYQSENIKRLCGSKWYDNAYSKSKYLFVQNKIKISRDKIIYISHEDSVNGVIESIHALKDDSFKVKILEIVNKVGISDSLQNTFSGDFERIPIKWSDMTDSVVNFRPLLNFEQKPLLYLSDNYENILIGFLNESSSQLDKAGNLLNSKKKETFLRIMSKNWDLNWNAFFSCPQAYYIFFDKSMTRARIDFCFEEQGGTTLLKKENGVWKIVSSKRTWIE